MDEFEVIYDNLEVQKYLLEYINLAKETIFISAWNIDLTHIIDEKNSKSLFDILKKKCESGVKVFVMGSIAPGTLSKSNNLNLLKDKTLHPNFQIKILDMEKSSLISSLYGLLNKISPLLSFKDCCNRLFHQRYLLVDDKYCLISGTDSNEDKQCSLKNNLKNDKGFIWVEYSVKIKPNQDIINYVRENFRLNGKATLESKLFYGNFYNTNTEYNKIIEMINNSKKVIFIENQWLNSSNKSKNEIILTIANKIISEHKKNNNMKIIFILERNFIDDCSDEAIKYKYSVENLICFFYSNYFQYFLFESLYFLKTYLDKNNIDFDKHIHIYNGTREIFIHSKNWIFDFENMLIGSSNIWDRSYTHSNDMELSILLKGKNIKTVQKNIIKQYNKDSVLNSSSNDEFINDIIKSLDNSKYLNKLKYVDIYDPFKMLMTELFLRIIFIIILVILYKSNKN